MVKGKKSQDTGNYYQVIMKNGKTYGKLFRDPQRAIRTVGAENVLKLREVLKEQVTANYTGVDAITGAPEESL